MPGAAPGQLQLLCKRFSSSSERFEGVKRDEEVKEMRKCGFVSSTTSPPACWAVRVLTVFQAATQAPTIPRTRPPRRVDPC